MADQLPENYEQAAVDHLRAELAKVEPTARKRLAEKLILAALGSLGWVGGFLSAAASFKMEEEPERRNFILTQWLEGHQHKLEQLKLTLAEIQRRLESLGGAIAERIESEEYLQLVRKAFRVWDEADTEQKRRYAANLVVNSCGTRVCSDDVVRLFLDWLQLYHETHFAVIREIYKNPGSSRYEIWTNLYGESMPREDSAEADLYRLLIRDLSTGGVIRQERDVDQLGRFVRKTPRRTRKGYASSTMESAFEDSKPYVLTKLGEQFVHYTMNEVVTRLEGPGINGN